GFTVGNGTARITEVSPNTGLQGQQNESVAITGQFTHWVQGTTTASFGAGIAIATVTVNSATSATVVSTVHLDAAVGSRDVAMTTGGEVATKVGGFTVQPGLPQLTEIIPNAAAQGDSLTVFISALYTSFTPDLTTVDLGAGITTG